jgi:hypothetical protein
MHSIVPHKLSLGASGGIIRCKGLQSKWFRTAIIAFLGPDYLPHTVVAVVNQMVSYRSRCCEGSQSTGSLQSGSSTDRITGRPLGDIMGLGLTACSGDSWRDTVHNIPMML